MQVLKNKNYLPELTLSTTMIFGISGYGSNNRHAIFCRAKGLGEGPSCGNVLVKNKDNRFLFLKRNYIYLSILFHGLGAALLSSPKKV